jgi:atypical dual specificity phosphatase
MAPKRPSTNTSARPCRTDPPVQSAETPMRITWLLPDRLAASGMIYPEDLPDLHAMGIEAVVSLSVRSPFPGGPPNGIAHLHLPVPDMTSPLPSQMDRAVAFIDEVLDEGRSAIVHCAAGYGRTGTMLACYLVAKGRLPEQAMEEVRAARPGSIETYDQEQMIRRYRPAREE